MDLDNPGGGLGGAVGGGHWCERRGRREVAAAPERNANWGFRGRRLHGLTARRSTLARSANHELAMLKLPERSKHELKCQS